jgi:hypothetical protein
MGWAGLYPWAAFVMTLGLLMAAVPAGAQTTPTPTARPTAAATATAVPTPSFVPAPPTLQPVANDDPRFGAVQAINAPQAAANAGVKWERLIFPWNEIQPNGPSDFEQGWFSEQQINGELARGVQLVGITLYTPAWAARDPQNEARSVPKNLELPIDHPQNYFASYIKRLVAKYRGRIDTWVILNEPDIYKDPDDFRTFAGTPADYAQVLRVAYLAAKSANPNVTIVMSGFTYWWDHEAHRPLYFQRVLDAIGGDREAPRYNWYFDAVDAHTYGNPLNGFNIPTTFRRIMRDKGLDKPIWIIESNVLARDDPKTPTNDPSFRGTMEDQASYIIENMALAMAADVQRYSIYKMSDEDAEVGDQYWGLVRNDGSVRPSYVAFQTGVKTFQRVRSATYYWWGSNIPPTEQEITNVLASNANRFQWVWPAPVNVVVMDKSPQRLTVIWNASPQAVDVSLPAYSASAQIMDKYGRTSPLAARNGYYELSLEPSRNNSDPRDRTLYLVGGSPWIIVEDMNQAIAPAPTLTFTPTATATPTAVPTATLLPGQTPPPTASRTPTRPPSSPFAATPTPTIGPPGAAPSVGPPTGPGGAPPATPSPTLTPPAGPSPSATTTPAVPTPAVPAFRLPPPQSAAQPSATPTAATAAPDGLVGEPPPPPGGDGGSPAP